VVKALSLSSGGAREYAGKRVEFIHLIAENCRQEWRGDYACAGIDDFRRNAHGVIVAHGDVLQVVPVAAKNSNKIN
jgi:hypothetical protein